MPAEQGAPADAARGEDAGLILLYGLVAFGQIQLRKIDGHKELPAFIAREWKKVA